MLHISEHISELLAPSSGIFPHAVKRRVGGSHTRGELVSRLRLRIEGNEFEAHGIAHSRLSLLDNFILSVG